MAAPMPEPAPVTTAAFPWRSNMNRPRKLFTVIRQSQRKPVYFNAKVWFLSPQGGAYEEGVRRGVRLHLTVGAFGRCAGFPRQITGRITDASGARLPGVTVTVANVSTNV